MKKYMLHIICCLISLVLLAGCISSQTDSSSKYRGTLLFRNSATSSGEEIQSLMKIELPGTEQTPLGINGFNARFANSKDKILVEQTSNICFYNTSNNELSPIYSKRSSSSVFSSISFVDENRFTIVEGANLFLFNIHNKEKQLLADDIGNSVHDTNNRFVYYSINPKPDVHKICRVDIETGDTEILFNGIRPKVSKDGRLIAYYTFKTGNELVVKNIETEQSWTYSRSGVVNYCFSPDGHSLAIVAPWNGNGYYDGKSIYIWDYETNQESVILQKYASGQCIDIDWIE
ncbi:MAG: hypothetical protein IJO83_01560 [Clostridia bacterium]|nr:hypothetical protein [Clostridia bacterium]